MTEPSMGTRLVLFAFIALAVGAIILYHYLMDARRPGAKRAGEASAPPDARDGQRRG
jgi:hypothetical protein